MPARRAWVVFLSVVAVALPASSALAGNDPFSLDDDAPPAKPGADAGAPIQAPINGEAAPLATMKPHAFTLEECLALADRNFPNLWAARARLAYAHGQLEEAQWVPFWQWSMSTNLGVLPTIGGTTEYTASGQSVRNLSGLSGLAPFWTVDVNGALPLYSFGKITAARQAGEANVRYNEWDLEKW
ncbi:MAG TPA: hypothetical protein VGI39_30495, partial [Polyangiaceae bacterium]